MVKHRYMIAASRCLLLILLSGGGGLLLPETGAAARFLTPLTVQAPATGVEAPAMAGTPLRWLVQPAGGVSPYRYRFFIRDAGENKAENKGTLALETRQAYWDWVPAKAGYYRIRAEVEDDRGMVAESDWSAPFEVVPALQVDIPQTVMTPPVMSQMQISWTTSATGGLEPYRFAFQWRLNRSDPSEEFEVEEAAWTWIPARAGQYQVRAVAYDSLGNRAESMWSESWPVNPIFQVVEVTPDRAQVIADSSASIVWKAVAEGGRGDYRYQFSLYRDDQLLQETEFSEMAEWTVTGWPSGSYRVRAIVDDSYGNRVEGWSEHFQVGLRRIAVLPIYNLSSAAIPAAMILNDLQAQLQSAGHELVGPEQLNDFMVAHRWRHTGFLSRKTAADLRQELEVDAVLLTGILDYQDNDSPRIAMVSRLVGTGSELPVLWAFGKARHGEAHPGFLGLKRVYKVEVLLTDSISELVASLVEENLLAQSPGTVLPVRSESVAVESLSSQIEPLTVALFPFANHTELERGGEILSALLLVNLVNRSGIRVLEPGLVRDSLLGYRIIAPDGPSHADMELLYNNLKADYLVMGTLTRYSQPAYDPARLPPETGFFLKVLDLDSWQLVSQYSSFGKGDQRVYFYDYQRFWTAYDLTEYMLSKIINKWLQPGAEESILSSPET